MYKIAIRYSKINYNKPVASTLLSAQLTEGCLFTYKERNGDYKTTSPFKSLTAVLTLKIFARESGWSAAVIEVDKGISLLQSNND